MSNNSFKDVSGKPLIQLVSDMIVNATQKRSATAIRFKYGRKWLKIQELVPTGKDRPHQLPYQWKTTGVASIRLAHSIKARLKVLSDINITIHDRVQVGVFQCRVVPWSKDERRGDGQFRIIRVISTPTPKIGDDVIIDLISQ